MEQYGYIRISTKDQNPERQLIAMRENNIKDKDILIDRVSGKNFERPQYARLLKLLKKGIYLLLKALIAWEEILEQWRIITKEIGADIRVLDMHY